MGHLILAINPGSTSTKLAVYEDENLLWSHKLSHPAAELERLDGDGAELDYRMAAVHAALAEGGFADTRFDAIIGRGGFVKPIKSGTYIVDEEMLYDLSHPTGHHASNFGGIMAHRLAAGTGVPAFIADPVVVDELQPVARYSGLRGVQRRSVFHALNHKAVARRLAAALGMEYEAGRFIIAHMGGGTSVGAHRFGEVVDATNGIDGEGAFATERSGALPLRSVVELCYGGRTRQQVQHLLVGGGGVVSYLGSNDLVAVENRMLDGDEAARAVLEALAYQTAKDIGACAAVLKGQVDAIALTGGVARCPYVNEVIEEMVGFIAPVHIYPGEDEMEALGHAALAVLQGARRAMRYAEGKTAGPGA